MLNVVICILGVLGLLLVGEKLSKAKIIKGEDSRKFVHITVGTFIASWPWLISWQAIQVIGLLMLLAITANHYRIFFNFSKSIKRRTYGEYFFALAITVCAMLTTNKVFFAIAMAHLALADGLAAVAGTHYGKKLTYKVFGQKKTVIGTMTFWITSLFILGFGLLFVHDLIPYSSYYWLILLLPPVLTIAENAAVFGLDNIVVPVLVIVVLKMAQT
ncbi:MAG TPA: hypothetical protein VMT23_03120 [Candidatus Binatia bacterium]|nr:hypothetical protein [Candidatus Binatia bacterium]